MRGMVSTTAAAASSRIIGVGAYRPSRVVHNAELVELIDSTPGQPAHRRSGRDRPRAATACGHSPGRDGHRQHLGRFHSAGDGTCAAQGAVDSGALALLVGFGAGLTYAAMVGALP